MKLTNKIKITGTITATTGLHIGGNKSSIEIGGVDLNVIKTGIGRPYIPGSSLKGKLRSLLAKVRGSDEAKNDPQNMKELFGDSGANDSKNNSGQNTSRGATRLFVRDANLDTIQFEKDFGGKDNRERTMDFDYSEVKTENTIDRSRGTAQHPRQIERIPAGAIFNFEIVLDIYDTDKQEVYLNLLREAFELLNMDYLGGHGSRGSGRVELAITKISGKTINPNKIENMDEQSLKSNFADLIIQNSVG